MSAKLVAVSIITFVIMLLVGVMGLFFLMVGMNGVSESKANPIFIGYLALMVFCSLMFGIGSGWGAGALARATSWPMWAVAPLAVVVTSVAGSATLFFGGIVIMLGMGVK